MYGHSPCARLPAASGAGLPGTRLVDPMVIPLAVIPVPESVMITGVGRYIAGYGLISSILDVAPVGVGRAIRTLDTPFEAGAARVVYIQVHARAVLIAVFVYGHVIRAVGYGKRDVGSCVCGRRWRSGEQRRR